MKLNDFVPLEHPRHSHQTMKNNIFIFKIHLSYKIDVFLRIYCNNFIFMIR